jgi:SAM-dependent methyltransferase
MAIVRSLLDQGIATVRKILGRTGKTGGGGTAPQDLSLYESKLVEEVTRFTTVTNVNDLPEIFHYWSNKYLVPKYTPFGFGNPKEFYIKYMTRVCTRANKAVQQFISVGSGNCDLEVDLAERLIRSGINNFRFECLDVNSFMLDRGRSLAEEKGVTSRFTFLQSDINSWRPERRYQVVLANHSLHHFVELEVLFHKIHQSLASDGYFLTDDMIGRNGHMRWPEALDLVNLFWKELPERYKYNHLLKRVEIEYENWDCSREGFEGIRAQDILPLLMERFHFDLFVGYANLIDIFVDRCFGHNYDPNSKWDTDFIDRVHLADEENLEKGVIKPTHMTAAMVKHHCPTPKVHKHLTPEFCVRRPDA